MNLIHISLSGIHPAFIVSKWLLLHTGIVCLMRFIFYICLKMPEESLIMDFGTGWLIFFGALLYYIRVITHRYL